MTILLPVFCGQFYTLGLFINTYILAWSFHKFIKVGLSPLLFAWIESPLKMMKNVFYFTLKALSILKIFTFLSWLFGHVGKRTWLERKIRLTSKFIMPQPGLQTIAIDILPISHK